jgi:putative component of membrane protein insertase Oxa1/YidC/SpoIIIJ protein YidD
MIRKNIVIFFILSICSAPLVCLANTLPGDDNFTPWNYGTEQMKRAESKKELSIPATLLKGSFIVFSKYISPVDGDRCNMYPTCSAYSREAVEKHGFIMGYLLTVDRLIHETNEIDRAPKIVKWDQLRFLDPVSNNDFWWQKRP